MGAGVSEEAEGHQSHAEGMDGSGWVRRCLEEETPPLLGLGGCGLRGLWRGYLGLWPRGLVDGAAIS